MNFNFQEPNLTMTEFHSLQGAVKTLPNQPVALLMKFRLCLPFWAYTEKCITNVIKMVLEAANLQSKIRKFNKPKLGTYCFNFSEN